MFGLHPARTQSAPFPSRKQQLLTLPIRAYLLSPPTIIPSEARLPLLQQNHTSPETLISIKRPSIPIFLPLYSTAIGFSSYVPFAQ